MAQLGRLRWGGVVLALVVGLQASPGHAASGLVAMEASAKLQAKGCGKYAGNVAVELALHDDGTWRLSIEDDELTGTYEAGGKGDRTLTLSLDAGSLTVIETGLRILASGVCGVLVDSASVTPKVMRAKINKAGTSASLLLKVSLKGDGNPLKKGRYTLSGSGALGPLPTTTSTTLVTTTSTVTTTVATTFTTTTTTSSVSSTVPSTFTTTTATVETTSSTLDSTTTTTTSSSSSSTETPSTLTSTTVTSSTETSSTLTSTSTTTTLVTLPIYQDCVNGGPEVCSPAESCLQGTLENGDTVGLCTRGCTSDEECPSAATGGAVPFCELANSDSCLLRCDGGQSCPDGMTCVESTFCVYVKPCTPNCADAVCGDNGCGGSCGDCSSGETCEGGQCVECIPNCSERTCGSDGCGGSCGSCETAGDVCSTAGQCVSGTSCVGRCGDVADPLAFCQCGPDCGLFEDCCADKCQTGVCDGLPECAALPPG